MIPPHVRKQANTVAWRLDWMGRTFGFDRLLVIHLTSAEPWGWDRWYRQWNNLWKKRLSRHYAEYLLVPEFSPKGLLHAHAVVVAKEDVSGPAMTLKPGERQRNAAQGHAGGQARIRHCGEKWGVGT